MKVQFLKTGLKSPGLSNQTRPKASCKFLAAFVKSPPFLQLKKTYEVDFICWEKHAPVGRSKTKIRWKLEIYGIDEQSFQ